MNLTSASKVSIFHNTWVSFLNIFLEKKNEIIPIGKETRTTVNNIHKSTDIFNIRINNKLNTYFFGDDLVCVLLSLEWEFLCSQATCTVDSSDFPGILTFLIVV